MTFVLDDANELVEFLRVFKSKKKILSGFLKIRLNS